MSAISQRIDAIVRQALDQPLKERGFERQGRSFRRAEGGGRIAVLQVQGSKWNYGDRGRFTVNLGIWQPMLGQPLLQRPKEYECQTRQRIGFLLPEYRQDHWWRLDAHTDDAAIAQALRQAVLEHGLPWFEAQRPSPVTQLAEGWLTRLRRWLQQRMQRGQRGD